MNSGGTTKESFNLKGMKTVKNIIVKMFQELEDADIQIQAAQSIAKRDSNRKL